MPNHFANLTLEQQIEYQRRANHAKRTPALRKAWENKDKLKKEHETKSINKIAEEWRITPRSTSRIIKSG